MLFQNAKSALFAILIPFCLAFGQDSVPWHAADAEARIRFSVANKRAPSLFVPIPESLSEGVNHVVAFDDKGVVLAASPVLVGGRLVGASVDATKLSVALSTYAKPSPVASLYLLAKPDPKAVPYAGQPVVLDRRVQSLTTRGHSAAEMMRLFGNLRQSRREQLPPIAVSSLGGVPDKPGWSHPREQTFVCAIMHWEALWNVDAEKIIRFGADQTHVAWTVLLDGFPVANWQPDLGKEKEADIELRPEGAGRFCQPVKVAPGLHTLQFLAVQGQGQNIPQLLIKTEGEKGHGNPPAGLIPSARPFTLKPERKADKELTAFSTLLPFGAATFATVGDPPYETLSSYRFIGDATKVQVLKTTGEPATPVTDEKEATRIFLTGHAYPDISIQGHLFKGQQHWVKGRSIPATARIEELEPLVNPAEPINAKIQFNWPGSFPKPAELDFMLTFEDEQGQQISTSAVKPKQAKDDIYELEFNLPQNAANVNIAVRLYEMAIPCQAGEIKFFRPKDARFPITAQGKSLFDGADLDAARVVCIADPLPEELPGKRSSTGFKSSIVMLDDFIAARNAPGATLRPESVLAELLAGKGLHTLFHVSVSNSSGTDSQLAILANLGTAIQLKPKTVVLAVGQLGLIAGLTPLEMVCQLQFAAQACLANGIEPILVTLPAHPKTDSETARLAALYTKELAVRLAIPVIDLHAQGLKENVNTQDWYKSDAIGLATPNNAARLWLTKNIAENLESIYR
jgi:hypothetical protein